MTKPFAIDAVAVSATAAGLHEALVIEAAEAGRCLVVPVGGPGLTAPGCEAASAEGVPALRAGDRVLLAVTEAGTAFVLARLCEAVAADDSDAADPSTDVGADGRIGVRVCDLDGHEIVRVDRRTRTVVVAPETGDLELAAPQGRIAVSARDGIAIETAGDMAVTASGVRLVGQDVTVAATSVETRADAVVTNARTVTTTSERLVQVADTALTRTRRLAQWIEDRLTVNAGLVRMRAERDVDLAGERTRIKARNDVRIDGTRINIG